MARKSKLENPVENKGGIPASEIAKLAAKMVPVPVISPFRGISEAGKSAVGDIDGREKSVAKIRQAAGNIQQEVDGAILPYGITLQEVQRMSMQLMSFGQISAVFGLPVSVFLDCLKRFPSLRHAYEGGAANAIDRASAVVRAAVELGDTGMAKFVLERKGGWEPPRQAAQVVVVGPTMANVDGSHVTELASMQRAIRDAPDAELA